MVRGINRSFGTWAEMLQAGRGQARVEDKCWKALPLCTQAPHTLAAAAMAQAVSAMVRALKGLPFWSPSPINEHKG